MLEGRDFIMFGGDWDRHPFSLQHIAEVLRHTNRVLWVGGIPIRGPKIQAYDLTRIVEKGRKMLVTSANAYDRSIPVPEVHPLFIPFYDIGPVRRWNDRMLRSMLLKKIQQLGFKDYPLLTPNPMIAGVIGTLGESSSHYFCLDNYAANKGAFRILEKLERDILQKVDSCWSLSDSLMRTRIPRSGENHFFREGVNLDHFKRTGGPVPEALQNVPKPIVGYCGLLEWWVDFDLIVRCARAFPEATFVLLGAAKVDISMLSGQPNILCLGQIPLDELPRYMEMFDVGLIPRKINRLTEAMNPLKLLEYLAMGLAVVSSYLPEVRKFKEHVYVAEDGEQFVSFLGKALMDQAPARRQQREGVAARHSWKSVAAEICDVIQRIEQHKQKSTARDFGSALA